MTKICRVFLKPGGLQWIDMTPTGDFSFVKFVTDIRAYGFANESCYIPPENIQCVLYNDPAVLMSGAQPAADGTKH